MYETLTCQIVTEPVLGSSVHKLQFQKISIHTPRKVNRNSNGEGNFKSTIFQRLNLNFQRVGGRGSN